jgi:hypothetical protein
VGLDWIEVRFFTRLAFPGTFHVEHPRPGWVSHQDRKAPNRSTWNICPLPAQFGFGFETEQQPFAAQFLASPLDGFPLLAHFDDNES